ncbi:MAG: GAF domain-containing protein, partial [Candidatus Rokubacteria bacterium]|nr:GAF domain-containing protein [Candidatus Rokubacteria bacterium]
MAARLRLGSLRTRLLGAFFLLSVLPLALVGVVVSKQGVATLKAQILERLSAVALLKSQQIEEWMKERRNDVKQRAAIPPFQQHVVTLIERAGHPEAAASYQALQQILDRLRTTGEFTEMFLVDAEQGKVLLSSDPEQEGKFKTDRPYFREGRERPFVQHIYYSIVLGKAVMAFSAPVLDSQGRTVAVLVGRADLKFLDRLMAERSGLGETGRTFLVNKFNYFVSESLGRAEHGWKPVFTEGVKRALAGEMGTGLYLNHENRAVVGAYRGLPDLGVALMAEVDEAEALAPVRTFRVVLIAVLALVAGVALLLGLDLCYEISKPVTRLMEAARAIGGGDLTHRVEVKHPDELTNLASAVNFMADELLRSRRQLESHSRTLEARVEERTRELSVLLTVAGTVGSTLDLTEILRRVAREVARLLDADMVGAYVADSDGTALRPVAGYHVPQALRDSFRAFPIPLRGHRFLEEAWESEKPVFTSDASADLRIDPEIFRRFPHRSVLCVPVATQEGPIGALLAVWWEVERRFAPEELRLVEGIASQTAPAVARHYDFRVERLTPGSPRGLAYGRPEPQCALGTFYPQARRSAMEQSS